MAGCNKRFTEYSSLYKHHVVHTHSKPYICNVCGKTYRQTSTLAMHKRTSHGIVDSNETDAVNNLEVEMTGKSWKNRLCIINVSINFPGLPLNEFYIFEILVEVA